MRSEFQRAIRYLQGVIGLDSQDIILSSYPRSGSTWLRFLFCNILSLLEWKGKTIDFTLLNQTMVELGVSNLVKPWRHTAIPRIVKTHKPYWSVFGRAGGAIGVVRDPRDVMVSLFHFKKDRQGSYNGNFTEFIHNRDWGLEAWFHHYTSWLSHWTLVVRYEDMTLDTCSEFSRILNMLGVGISEKVVREAMQRSCIQKVRSFEASSNGSQTREAHFARDGSTQQWREYFSAADIAYYNALIEKYGIDVFRGAQVR